jgi:hypothetical protein
MRSVIIAPAEDEHADAVIAALAEQRTEAVRFDVESLTREPFLVTDAEIRIGEAAFAPLEQAAGAPRGWIRRLAPPEWRRDVTPQAHEGVVRTAWLTLLGGVIDALPVEWLTPLQQLLLVENKLVQTRIASRLGVPMPATAVVSHRDQIPDEVGDDILVKPLGPADFVDEEGEARVVFAGVLARNDERLEHLHAAPFLVQQFLAAQAHLRVCVVRDQVWICELGAADRPPDWRRQDEAHDSFGVSVGHHDVRRIAVELCGRMGVGYASQDWVVTRHGAYFLDLNPSGQWLFLPDPVAHEVTAAIANWLGRP